MQQLDILELEPGSHLWDIDQLEFSDHDSSITFWNSGEGKAMKYPFALDQLAQLACQTAGRNLYMYEWNKLFPGEAFHKTCPQF